MSPELAPFLADVVLHRRRQGDFLRVYKVTVNGHEMKGLFDTVVSDSATDVPTVALKVYAHVRYEDGDA